MTVTGTNSHYSAEQFLVEQQHNYAAAPNDWVRLGYLPFVFPPQPETEGQPTRQPRGLRDVIANHETRDYQGRPVGPLDGTDEGDEIVRPRRLSDDGEELEEIFERQDHASEHLLPDEDEPDSSENTRSTYKRTGRRSFMINPDYSSVSILGVLDHTRFDIERIIDGKYSALSHRLQKIKKSDYCNDTRSLSLLSTWRNEEFAKITRELKRPEAVPFLRPEIDFLYFEEAGHFEHAFRPRWRIIAAANPDMAQQEARLRTMALFDEWPGRYQMGTSYQKLILKRFNEAFAQKIIYGSEERRPARTSNSLNQERRHRMICQDFQVSYQPARGSRILPKGRTDDEDSAYSKTTGRRGGAKPWVQPPPDTDDTAPEASGSDPISSSSSSDDDDDYEGGDGAGGDSTPHLVGSFRRTTCLSEGKYKDRLVDDEAASESAANSEGKGNERATERHDIIDPDLQDDKDEDGDEFKGETELREDSQDEYMAEDEAGGDEDHEGDDLDMYF